MELRTVRRGFAALAIATLLGLAGAHPAAAAELGLLERGLHWLSGLWPAEAWSAEDVAAPAGPLDDLFAWFMDESVEKGFGLDPNDGSQPHETPPSGEGE